MPAVWSNWPDRGQGNCCRSLLACQGSEKCKKSRERPVPGACSLRAASCANDSHVSRRSDDAEVQQGADAAMVRGSLLGERLGSKFSATPNTASASSQADEQPAES